MLENDKKFETLQMMTLTTYQCCQLFSVISSQIGYRKMPTQNNQLKWLLFGKMAIFRFLWVGNTVLREFEAKEEEAFRGSEQIKLSNDYDWHMDQHWHCLWIEPKLHFPECTTDQFPNDVRLEEIIFPVSMLLQYCTQCYRFEGILNF